MPILEVHDLSIRFGGLIAVDHVSFSVESGEIMGLIGPNGAGKTTVLNLISGIYRTESGSVFLNGKDVTRSPAYVRARMGLSRTFQTPRLLQRSTVLENILLGADLASSFSSFQSFLGRKDPHVQEEIELLFSIAGFHPQHDEDIDSLPYGQRKRLELVRALLTHPKVILVDEPAAGLNGKELEQSIDLLRYACHQGVGIVLIEHKMDLIMSICDNIAVLNFGKLIANGPPQQIAADDQVIEAYLGRKERHA